MANSKIYLGSINIGSLFKGASDISIYLGAEKVYPLGEPSFDGKWLATYSDSHVESAQCGSSSEIEENEINKTNLVSVEVGDCVTSIGDSAFQFCRSLTSIDIPNSVTTIGGGVFYGCSSLTSVTIPDSVTSISSHTFHDCSSLTSIDVPDSVTSIGKQAFHGCGGLTSIDIPNSVTTIGESVFYNCKGLTSVTISDSVTEIGANVFYNCKGLTSVTVNAKTPPALGTNAFNKTNCPIYVPADSVSSYKSSWIDYASRIQAIPTNWVLVEDTFANPRKVKVDYSLIEDDDSEIKEDYQLYSQDLAYAIFYLNQPTLEWIMEQGYGGDELVDYYQKVGLFSESDGIIGILEDGVEYTSIGGVNLSDCTLSYISSSMPNYYIYATL